MAFVYNVRDNYSPSSQPSAFFARYQARTPRHRILSIIHSLHQVTSQSIALSTTTLDALIRSERQNTRCGRFVPDVCLSHTFLSLPLSNPCIFKRKTLAPFLFLACSCRGVHLARGFNVSPVFPRTIRWSAILAFLVRKRWGVVSTVQAIFGEKIPLLARRIVRHRRRRCEVRGLKATIQHTIYYTLYLWWKS
jgi:hypothetical protein